jgi:desampylase
MDVVVLAPPLRAQIEREARAAFPRECCGLIEGARDNAIIRVSALHPARNLSERADRFEIDPADHFRALHAARANGCKIVGCYHSHPNGIAAPSEQDRTSALDENFVWLVCGIDAERAEISAWLFAKGQFQALKWLESASA